MDRARLVRIVYRDSYLLSLKRFIFSKPVIISVILIGSGISLFATSLQHNDVIQSSFVQSANLNVSDNGNTAFYFAEPANIMSNVTFTMPAGKSAFLQIYKVDNYTHDFIQKTSYTHIYTGAVSSGERIQVNSVYNPQGQLYMIQMNTSSTSSFTTHVSVTAMIILTEHADRNLGGPGIMLGMAGALIFSASVSRIYRRMKYF